MNRIQIGRLISPNSNRLGNFRGVNLSVDGSPFAPSLSFVPGESFTSPKISRRKAASLRPVGRWKPRDWLDLSSAYNFKRKSQLYPMAVLEPPEYVQKMSLAKNRVFSPRSFMSAVVKYGTSSLQGLTSSSAAHRTTHRLSTDTRTRLPREGRRLANQLRRRSSVTLSNRSALRPTWDHSGADPF